MKILKITLQGINSIKHKYQIDLTHPEYTAQGIFAIVGTTGAGKSTILDAICLAIYGRTPRVENINKENNEIINKDSYECMAEVLIQIDNNIYSFYFAQHRANKSVNGNLQKQRREIRQAIDGNFVVINSKTNQANKVAKDILNMDFSQFTRSVMLAQGNFSAFLQSEHNERGELLEKITGTQIYAKIGEYIYKTHKSKSEVIKEYQNKLSDIVLLNDDELSQLNTVLGDTINQKNSITQKIERLNKLLLKKQDYENLKNQQKQVGLSLQNLQLQIDEFKPKAYELNCAINAQKIAPMYDNICTIKNDINQLTLTGQDLQKKQDEHQANLKNGQLIFEKLEEDKQVFDKKFNELLPLIEEAKKIDTTITYDAINLNIHNQALTTRNIAINNTQDTINKLTIQNQNYQSDIEKIHKNLADIKFIESYIDSDVFISQISEPFNNFLQICQNTQNHIYEINNFFKLLAHSKDDLIQLNTQKQKLQKDTQSVIDDINNYKQPIDDYLKKYQKDNTDCLIKHLNTQKHDIRTLVFELLNLQNNYKQSIKQQHTMDALQKTIDDKQHELQKLGEQLSYTKTQLKDSDESIKYLTDTLKIAEQSIILQSYLDNLDDDTPCPLCGSTTHPKKDVKADSTIYDIKSHIKDTEQKLNQQTKNHKNLQHQMISLDKNYTTFEQYINIQTTQYNDIKKLYDTSHLNITQSLKKINDNIIAINGSFDKVSFENIQDLINDLQDYTQKIEQDIDHIEYHTKQIASLTDVTNNLKNDISLIDTQILMAKNTYNQYIDNINNTLTTLSNNTDNHTDCFDEVFDIANKFNHIIDNSFLLDVKTSYQKFNYSSLSKFDDDLSDKNFIDSFNANQDIVSNINEHYHSLLNCDIKENTNKIYTTLKSIKDNYIKNINNIKDIDSFIQKNTDAILYEKNTLQKLSKEYQEHKINTDKINSNISVMTDKKIDLIGVADTAKFECELTNKKQIIYQNYQEQKDILNDLKNTLELTFVSLTNNQQQLSDMSDKLNELNSQFDTKLAQLGFKDCDDFLSKCRKEDTIDYLSNIQEQQKQTLAKLQGQNTQISNYINTLSCEITNIDDLDISQLQSDIKDNIGLQDKLNRSVFELQSRLNAQKQNSQAKQDLIDELDKLSCEFELLNKLNTLIGSADGRIYRNIVQSLTLDYILGYANQALQIINDRYLLTSSGDNDYSLDIKVIDQHQADSIRPTKTLSGGETFLVSLALALGLSNIQSHNMKIESLFLDEGFGTLDEDTLEMAMTALNELHQTGKMIGLISHVDSLKQRISTHIEVTKQGGGISTIRGMGVHKIT